MPLFCFIIFSCVNSVTSTMDTHRSVKTSAGCPARRLSFPVGGLSNEDPPPEGAPDVWPLCQDKAVQSPHCPHLQYLRSPGILEESSVMLGLG